MKDGLYNSKKLFLLVHSICVMYKYFLWVGKAVLRPDEVLVSVGGIS
jgi:hypothetical protein